MQPALPKLLAAMKQKWGSERYAALNGRLDLLEGAVRAAKSALPDGRMIADLSREERAQLLKDIVEAKKFIATAEGPKIPMPQPPVAPIRHFATRPGDRFRRR
jgi:hypothetical protein